MIFRFLFLSLVFSFFYGCTVPPKMVPKEPSLTIDQLIEGWPEMIEQIKRESTRVEGLNNKNYRLKVLLEGDWNLSISPQRAFRIEKGVQQNVYSVTVINPFVLFETVGGLSKMTYIQAELSKAGGEQGAIELDSRVECLYRVRFFQSGGALVDFGQLSTAYDYDFLVSPQGSLGVHSMTTNSVTFARAQESLNPATVQVQLSSKNKKEVYLSNPVQIPACHRSLTFMQEEELKRRPGLCIRHLQTEGSIFDQGSKPEIEIKEVFGNNCDREIRCTMSARFGLVKDKKVVNAADKKIEFTIEAQKHQEVLASHSFSDTVDFDSKIYLGSRVTQEAQPIGFEVDQYEPLVCDWN
jgi:hypothetical protein